MTHEATLLHNVKSKGAEAVWLGRAAAAPTSPEVKEERTTSKKAVMRPSAEPSPQRSKSWYTWGLKCMQSRPNFCGRA